MKAGSPAERAVASRTNQRFICTTPGSAPRFRLSCERLSRMTGGFNLRSDSMSSSRPGRKS